MRAGVGKSVLVVVTLIASACGPGPEQPANPVTDRDTGAPDNSAPDAPEAECEDLPAGIGEAQLRPRIELPGQARALVARKDKAWACGSTHAGSGFVVSLVTKDGGKSPTQIEQRTLDAPCLGMVLGDTGLALLLDRGRVLWLPVGQAKLKSLGATTQTSAMDLSGAATLRGAWSKEPAALYLAAGHRGVRRLWLRDSILVEDPDFVGPKLQNARDVALLGEQLIVADSGQGLLVWNLKSSKLDAQWTDLSYVDRPGTQRVVSMPEGRLAIAAGHAGTYLLERKGSGLALLDHTLHEEPVFDLGAGAEGVYALTSSRLYERSTLLHQSFPELEGQAGFAALAPGPKRSLWLARGAFVELLEQPAASKHARLVPLLGFGTALHGVLGNATSELTFEVKGEGRLWVQRPESPPGSGLLIEALDWPTQPPSCSEYASFEAGQRFSLRVRASNPEKLAKTVPFRLRSSDPEHPDLGIAVDLDRPGPREGIAGTLPSTPLVRTTGHLAPIQRAGAWNWLEFVSSQRLSAPETLEGLYALVDLVQSQRRNGHLTLVASVVVGGRYPRLEPLLWAELERLRDLGLEFYFDERFAMHRSFAHLPNGRLYPLRVLVDPQSRIRYLDQHQGKATAMAKYRQLRYAL